MKKRAVPSRKAEQFTESVIREMTRLAQQHDAVNLSQGFPDFPAPAEIKAAACAAILGDVNQYAVTWGARPLRTAIAAQFTRRHGVPVDPDTQITVCCGATETMMATLLATVDPGDEVIVFEPFYENYGPDAIVSGAVPRFVRLHEPDWRFDPDELAAAFSNRTRAIVINTPNNPTGKVFSRDELSVIAALCQKWDVLAITDEIYEHIVYDGHQHVPLASLDGMADRTVTINGLSKTFSVTGWRIGWAIAPGIAQRRDPQDARLPDGGRAGAAPGGGRRGPRDGRRILQAARGGLRAAARHAARDPRAPRLHDVPSVRRVLHHDGHRELRIP